MTAVLKVMTKNRVEKIVDILVACAVGAGMSEHFTPETRSDEIGDWVREQLNACGFTCRTVGSSHCVLDQGNFTEALFHSGNGKPGSDTFVRLFTHMDDTVLVAPDHVVHLESCVMAWGEITMITLDNGKCVQVKEPLEVVASKISAAKHGWC